MRKFKKVDYTEYKNKGNYILLDPEDFYMNCFGF